MTNEQAFFLQILTDHLNGRSTAARADLDWPTELAYAQNHQVSGIVYEQCKSFLPELWQGALSAQHSTELFYYFNRVALFEQVTKALSEAEIPFFTVKGLDVAQFYPISALRTMGDCDIIVHPEDKEKAHGVMIGLGFENRLKQDIDWMYFKDGMEFEIHDHLLYNEAGNEAAGREFMDRAWNYAAPTENGTRYALDWSFHFVFLLLHLKKHLIHAGIGFRQFMDLDVVIRRCRLDWDWLEDSLTKLGLWDFAQVCFALLRRWFETPLPFETAELPDGFCQEATEKILANGIFGFDDQANAENKSLNAITRKSGPRWWGRLKTLLESSFPPYRNMRYVPHYAFLDGRPWLLPYAWLYRFCFAARNRMGANGKRIIGEVLIPDEKLDARERELAKWGL